MTTNAPLTLSITKPDFESILLQLQLFLKTKGSWEDLFAQGAGEALIEIAAAVGAMNQVGAEVALREAFQTAVRDSSIYAMTSMLGVRVTRKSPAQVAVNFTRTPGSSINVIHPMSQFVIDGEVFFNRQTITFNSADKASGYLYEGKVKTSSFAGSAEPFLELNLNEPGFVVSDADVLVSTVNADTDSITLWDRMLVGEGIWMADQDALSFQDYTDGNGDCVIKFGNGEHGAMPNIGTNILVMYALTKGSLGSNGGSNLDVTFPENAHVMGVTASAISGGSDEKSADFYRAVAPYIRRSGNRAITYSDYKALALAFPGVASVSIQAQRDIAPNDLRWSNVIRICVLPEAADVFTPNQWDSFTNYMQRHAHAAVMIQTVDPTKIDVNLNIRLTIRLGEQPGEIEEKVTRRIYSLFTKGVNSLGHMIALSDITTACKVPGVDYSEILTPKMDLLPLSSLSWYNPASISITVDYTKRTFGASR